LGLQDESVTAFGAELTKNAVQMDFDSALGYAQRSRYLFIGKASSDKQRNIKLTRTQSTRPRYLKRFDTHWGFLQPPTHPAFNPILRQFLRALFIMLAATQ